MFYPQIAPKHVERFKAMIKEGYYDGTRFHRCIPGFMIQGGDPYSRNTADVAQWGTGGYYDENGREVNIVAEFNALHHSKGVMSTARESGGFNTASSQFFIVQDEASSLDGQYTAWGKVVEGLDVIDKIVVTGDPAQDGKVDPAKAVVLKKATIQTWPVK
jgi:cyclophilin family peptidyl-prolyl cis-trans isomerase